MQVHRCVHECTSTCPNTYTEQDHTVAFQPDLKENMMCNWQWPSSWDEVFLLLVSNHSLENGTTWQWKRSTAGKHKQVKAHKQSQN